MSDHATAPDNTANRLFQDFEAQTGDKTFYSGHAAWLNNIVASAEDLWDTVSGDDSPDTWWGCADAAPALMQHMNQNDKTSGTSYETLTSRNWLGMQHNRVAATSPDGSQQVFDPWAGTQGPMPEHVDDTIFPLGQALELLVQQSVDPTGAGAGRSVTGNTRLDVSGPLSSAWDWATGLF